MSTVTFCLRRSFSHKLSLLVTFTLRRTRKIRPTATGRSQVSQLIRVCGRQPWVGIDRSKKKTKCLSGSAGSTLPLIVWARGDSDHLKDRLFPDSVCVEIKYRRPCPKCWSLSVPNALYSSNASCRSINPTCIALRFNYDHSFRYLSVVTTSQSTTVIGVEINGEFFF